MPATATSRHSYNATASSYRGAEVAATPSPAIGNTTSTATIRSQRAGLGRATAERHVHQASPSAGNASRSVPSARITDGPFTTLHTADAVAAPSGVAFTAANPIPTTRTEPAASRSPILWPDLGPAP